jgi:signal transduction histidine kinase
LADAGSSPRVSAESGVDQSGLPVTYEVTVVPLPAESDGARALLILADTTQQQLLRSELRQAERLASVGLTVANLAHTIKNILGGLQGGVYLVTSGIDRGDMDRVRGGWGMVQRFVEQLSGLVRNLLSYSSARTAQRALCDPRELIADVVSFYAEEGRRAGIEVKAEVAADTPPLRVDRDQLHACLSNLISNAIDASTWDPDLDKQHQITVRASRRADGGLLIEVEDNGAGIALEDQAKIMKTLFTTKGIRGTGLGLLLSRKAIAEHGGTISFESAEGQGTTFRVALPAASPTTTNEAPAAAPSSARPNGDADEKDPDHR